MQSRGLHYWHRRAANGGAEEIVVPNWESRTRVWLRSRVRGGSLSGCGISDGIDMERLRACLDGAP